MRVAAIVFTLFCVGCVRCLEMDTTRNDSYTYCIWAWDDEDDIACKEIAATASHIVGHLRDDFGTNRFHRIVLSVWDVTNEVEKIEFKIRGNNKEGK